MTDLPVLAFADAAALDAWLDEHAADAPGIWLRLAKKGSPTASVRYAEAVEVALCHGWIDGQARSLDEGAYLQRLTPRRPASVWSKVNRERAEALIASGRMRPAGLREVERAKADGRWEAAYDPPSRSTVPDDLRAALDAEPRAAEEFARLNATNRYAILHRVQTARRAETRARRIAGLVEMLARGERPHP